METIETITASQFRQIIDRPKNKYKAKRVKLDGKHFDSKAEANYYAALKIREKAGEVFDVELQKPYALVVNGFLVATYKADFVYFDDVTKSRRVIDVKGVQTTAFKLKRKLMKACLGIEVELAR